MMDCQFCGSPMDCIECETLPHPAAWFLWYTISWWACDACGAEAVVDGAAGPLDDPVAWAPPRDDVVPVRA